MALFDIIIQADNVTISDAITRQLNAGVAASFFDEHISDEEIGLEDLLQVSIEAEREVTDSVVIADSVSVTVIEPLLIQNARALTDTKVRIDFSTPALDPSGGMNPGLSNPASYIFTVVTPGAVDVIPQSVDVPPGQVNPLYVEVNVSEHTNGADYQVALSPAVLGFDNRAGNGTPFLYEGSGSPPIVERVMATSLNEVLVFFDESILNNAAANDVGNYIWNNGLVTTAVKSVVGNLVTLATSTQTAGQLYSLTVLGYNALFDEDGEVLIDEDGEVLVDEEDGG